MENLIDTVTEENFESFINQHELVFVDFWASWCAPCKQFAEVYENTASQFPQILFVKINIEKETVLADMLNIRSIPHLMIFKQGIAIYSEAGSMPQSMLTELVQQALLADVSELRKQIDEEDV